jgi:hypothetical protein
MNLAASHGRRFSPGGPLGGAIRVQALDEIWLTLRKRGVRFLEEGHIGMQHPVPYHRVIGVARTEQHLQAEVLRARRISCRRTHQNES